MNHIKNIRKNCMGTTSFDAKFGKMRKAQDFIVYPIKSNTLETAIIKIQSDKKIGEIDMMTGNVRLVDNGRFYAVTKEDPCAVLSLADKVNLMTHIQLTSNPIAGNNGIMHCDNGGAVNLMGAL